MYGSFENYDMVCFPLSVLLFPPSVPIISKFNNYTKSYLSA